MLIYLCTVDSCTHCISVVRHCELHNSGFNNWWKATLLVRFVSDIECHWIYSINFCVLPHVLLSNQHNNGFTVHVIQSGTRTPGQLSSSFSAGQGLWLPVGQTIFQINNYYWRTSIMDGSFHTIQSTSHIIDKWLVSTYTTTQEGRRRDLKRIRTHKSNQCLAKWGLNWLLYLQE